MRITLRVNGTGYDIEVPPRRTLADALREECGLTGTHLGCEHGVCGACTVLVDGDAVRSCLMFAVQCDGRQVRTVEGLAAADGSDHPLQAAFADFGGSQCGYCTPGMLMTAKGLLDKEPRPSRSRIREAISGNICRCTGYSQIVEAIDAAAAEIAGDKR